MSGPLTLAVAGLLAAACMTSAPPPPTDGSGLRLDVDAADLSAIVVRALYLGEADAELAYRMSVERTGAAGRSTSRQSGAVGASDTLAVTTVNGSPGDRLTVHLALLRAGTVVDSVGWDRTFGDG